MRLIEPQVQPVVFGRVNGPDWSDKPAILVGAAPSLKGFDLKRLQGLGHVVAVNGAMYDLPFADAWVTIDFEFIKNNEKLLAQPGPPLYIALPHGRAIGGLYGPKIDRAIYLQRWKRGGRLSTDPRALDCGGTSGFSAFNLAYLKRPRLIVLFGYDYDDTGHYCEDRYQWAKSASDWMTWGAMFNPLPAQLGDIKVLNASLISKIKPFPKVSHEAAMLELVRYG